jgi:hypothetical protein
MYLSNTSAPLLSYLPMSFNRLASHYQDLQFGDLSSDEWQLRQPLVPLQDPQGHCKHAVT